MSDLIKIMGVITDDVGTPKNDGTPGCALYEVPLRLSRAPSRLWADLFVQTWDSPPSFTTRHRPGICQIVGDQVVLTRTTVEEVAEVHKETLKMVLQVVNAEVERLERQVSQREKQQADAASEQRKQIVDAANKIQFDD